MMDNEEMYNDAEDHKHLCKSRFFISNFEFQKNHSSQKLSLLEMQE